MSKETDCTGCDDPNCNATERKPSESPEQFEARQALTARMCRIKHKIIVLSGKGGVGKSTVAVNLAAAIAERGKTVGILDIDVHGPSVPKLLNIENVPLSSTEDTLMPVIAGPRLKAMSIGLLLRGQDDAVIWRGPMKHGLIQQFLRDVEWGDLDYLVVDSPPGTGDEPLSIVDLIDNPDGAIIVTTPQQVSVQDVRRSISFCRQVSLPVIGVIENMSGFTCPTCGSHFDIFGSGGGRDMAESLGVKFLGAIPIDQEVVTSGESGMPMVRGWPQSTTTVAFDKVVTRLLSAEAPSPDSGQPAAESGQSPKNGAAKELSHHVAVPLADGQIAQHFGHCEQFAVYQIDRGAKAIVDLQLLTPPPHEPGLLPRWLGEHAHVVIAGGMGSRAKQLFEENGIEVVVGASGEPKGVVEAYLQGTLVTGDNVCDH